MYEIFQKLLDKRGLKAFDVSKATGISSSTLTDWKKGRSVPKQDKMQKIAEFLGVSLEYLMTGEEADGGETYYLNDETREIAQEIFENPDLRSLFDMSRKMPPERLKAHIEFIEKLYKQEKGEDY